MEKVRINKANLLSKLKTNRAEHKTDYDEAVIGHRKAVIEALEENLKLAKSGGKLETSIHMPAPITKVAEYDRAISMLEFSIDDTIELSMYEFDCYVLDNWDWKHQALLTNSTYKIMK